VKAIVELEESGLYQHYISKDNVVNSDLSFRNIKANFFEYVESMSHCNF